MRSRRASGRQSTPKPSPEEKVLDLLRDGELDQFKQALQEQPQIVNFRSTFNVTALHEAAYDGQLEIIRILLAAEAAINAIDKGGRTPLDYATQKDQQETVEFLKQQGALSGHMARQQRIEAS